ncbi:CHASE domain-containing protein [Colwellia sp. 12G3]|uniref:CHASE domain-containing protein n=1 Tax=Colwellia sp. 12G3 TaxID=2058299 RepID=UPI000C32866A|nr:CHASE domain-containing protein [Colwellia sp. 12G3]PKI18110.1 histidine kinase [Colwellia sp. 12G3]
MKKLHVVRFFISAILYIAMCYSSIWLINPQSLVNFVGPSAALMSGLLLIWGVTPLIAVLLISPILAVSLRHYFHLDANLAVMTIAVLAIILQGYWTKQLVFRFIEYKKWLTSRKHLFFFLLRIGPVASLVSASSVLIISMLDNQVIQGTFFYTFIHTWSTSMLVAVFFIPLFLLVKNAEQLKLAKRLFVGFTSLLGGLAIFLLLKTSQYEQQQYRQVLFNQSKVEIERLILAEVDSVVNNVNSLSALFKASEYVSLVEFNLFSQSIFNHDSSLRALEWAPIVPFDQREIFEKKSSEGLQKNFQIKEILSDGHMGLAQPRNQYAPLHYIYPQYGNQAALGLDVYSNPKHILSMQDIVDSEEVIASAPITLVQDELAMPGMLFGKAIFSPHTERASSNGSGQQKLSLIKKGKLLGFVVAVVQLDRFFLRLAQQKEQEVSFFIQDVSSGEPYILFGQTLPTKNRHADTLTIEVFSRLWQINIVENQPWFSQAKSWQAWAVLIGGTFGAVLFQMLVLMMAAYSSELSQQVNIKTRALILAKESSEQKSLAKSNFLQTLNKELRVPLLAVKAFVEQLKKKGINNKEVTGISHAGNNVALLLDTMMDLSDIESGKITAKEDCFDFYGFLQRSESILKASNVYEGKSIVFLIDESVPHYINSDELYIQKLLNTLIESAHHLLQADALRLTIKLHKHKLAEASLFFTLVSQSPVSTEPNIPAFSQQSHDKLTADSTALAMAIKYSQLLHGDTNLGVLSSGIGVLNSSIRVTVSSSDQQEAQQGLTFDLMS